ncbi:MAG: cell division protein FtsZ [Fidelibacterota bacterium]
MKFEFDETLDQRAKIKVIGVGGGGGNAVNRMIESGIDGVDFISVNTDAQDLEDSKAKTKIQIGKQLTRGLGAGGKNKVGEDAAKENEPAIVNAVKDADMVFITAGMGGGTGTGAAPKIAKIAKDNDCLTVAVVTMPFDFEGKKRRDRAEEGVTELKKNVDTLIVIPNQKLIKIVDRSTGLREAFRTADSILYQATKGISDLINNQGLMNLDFADIESIMKDKGDAIMGTGVATGESRASMAAQLAISSPLLDNRSICGASGILINISGGKDLSLLEYDEACKIITNEAGTDADIIVGAVEDKRFENEIVITVIATGFPNGDKDSDDELELVVEKKQDQSPEKNVSPIYNADDEDKTETKKTPAALETTDEKEENEPLTVENGSKTIKITQDIANEEENSEPVPEIEKEEKNDLKFSLSNISELDNDEEEFFHTKKRELTIKTVDSRPKHEKNTSEDDNSKETDDIVDKRLKNEISRSQPKPKKPQRKVKRELEQVDLFPAFLRKNLK